MKTDEAETKRNSLHGETEKSFFLNGKSLALLTLCAVAHYVYSAYNLYTVHNAYLYGMHAACVHSVYTMCTGCAQHMYWCLAIVCSLAVVSLYLDVVYWVNILHGIFNYLSHLQKKETDASDISSHASTNNTSGKEKRADLLQASVGSQSTHSVALHQDITVA